MVKKQRDFQYQQGEVFELLEAVPGHQEADALCQVIFEDGLREVLVSKTHVVRSAFLVNRNMPSIPDKCRMYDSASANSNPSVCLAGVLYSGHCHQHWHFGGLFWI